jgi:succinate dehydrogenase / fumarate reductase flavoprotein subunit
VPKNKEDCWDQARMMVGKDPSTIPESERDYYLERRYPTFGNLVPRDVASRAAKVACDAGQGVAFQGNGVYLDFRDAIARIGKDGVSERYGNLFEMYQRITGENPYETPMRIFPATHYTMGGLWVDYNLQSNIPGLFVIGEANFSDHGANRLGASALMQGLADGYFVLPYTIGDYLAKVGARPMDADTAEFKDAERNVKDRLNSLLDVKGKQSVDSFHRRLGRIIWNHCGMARDKEGLEGALKELPKLREEFWSDVSVPGSGDTLNQSLEKAARVADFLEFGSVMLEDALDREESCGAHFRLEHQTEEGEAKRNDKDYSYVSAWEFNGVDTRPTLHKEELSFEYVPPTQRSYK